MEADLSGTVSRWRTPPFILTALFVAEVTASFESAMIYAAINKLIAAFGDPAMVGWLVTSYLLVAAGTAAVAGRLGDIYGRRRIVVLLLGIGAIGSTVSALSTNFPLLLAGRAIQGLTGAVLPLCIGLARENLRPAKVPLGVGLIISAASIGAAIGLVAGGLIVDHFTWHGIFIASTVMAMGSILAILLCLPPSRRIALDHPVDWLSGILFVPGVAGLLLVISSGRAWGWFDWRSVGALVASFALLGIWARRSLRSPDPLIDVRLLLVRPVLIANIGTALLALGTMQIALVFSILLQAPVWTGIGLGVSATVAGLVKLPSNVGSAFGGPLSGFMTSRFGARAPLIAGGLVVTAGWLFAMFQHGSLWAVGIALCIISFGTTMVLAGGPNVIIGIVPPERTSEAVGVSTVVRQTFLGIGAQVVTLLLATSTVAREDGGARYPAPSAYMLAMGLIIALSLLSVAVAFLLPKNAANKSMTGRPRE